MLPSSFDIRRLGPLLWALLLPATPALCQCTFSLSPSSAQVSEGASTGSFTVTASASTCARTATSNDTWLTVTFGQSGTGNGSVGYSVVSNPTYLPRTGTITVSGAVFTITQGAPPCPAATISPTTQAVVAAGGSFSITITSPCGWNATTSASWITLSAASGTASGTLTYTVAPNNTGVSRSGTIQINGLLFAVTQPSAACTFTVSPLTANIAAAGGQNQITVQASASTCAWTVQNTATWIGSLNIVVGSPGPPTSGSGTVTYTVAANSLQQSRTAVLTVAGIAVSITQAAAATPTIQFTAQSLVNGASFLYGSIAPGELITIFGVGLGPNQPAGLQLTSSGGSITTTLAGTQVLINGIAAPLTYVSAAQVNAIVPFEVAGSSTAQVSVTSQGGTSGSVTESVASSSPAIFTVSGGTGQGAILNQDNSPNSASTPAAVGSVLQVFATGFGQTTPSGVDGQIAGPTASLPVQAVTATIGGINATVEYAGSSYGLVSGVIQVNVLIPAGVTTGNGVPIVLNVGGVVSPTGTTVAIH
jgi:uncharacterized protein (TIGR03437 family)